MSQNETLRELVHKYQKGDSESLEKLCLECRDFIAALAKKCCNQFRCFQLEEDLISAGMIALLQNIKRYHPDSKAELSTFLFPHYKEAMQNVLDQSLYAFTYSQTQSRMLRKAHAIYNKNYEAPKEERIQIVADEMNISVEEADGLLLVSIFPLSFDISSQCEFYENDQMNLWHGDPAQIIDYEMKFKYLKEAFEDGLSFKEREIVGGYFGVYGHKKRSLSDLGENSRYRRLR